MNKSNLKTLTLLQATKAIGISGASIATVILPANITTASIYLAAIAVCFGVAIYTAKTHYACWQQCPDTPQKLNPKKATLLLFIPLFNFYWTYQSYCLLPKLLRNQNSNIALFYAIAANAYIASIPFGLALVPTSILQATLCHFYYRQIAEGSNESSNN